MSELPILKDMEAMVDSFLASPETAKVVEEGRQFTRDDLEQFIEKHAVPEAGGHIVRFQNGTRLHTRNVLEEMERIVERRAAGEPIGDDSSDDNKEDEFDPHDWMTSEDFRGDA